MQVPHASRVHKKRLLHPFPDDETNAGKSDTVPLVSIVRGTAFNLVPMRDIEALGLPNRGMLRVEQCNLAEHLDWGSGWDVGYTGTFYYTELGLDSEDVDVVALRTRSIRTRDNPDTGSASYALCCYLAVVTRKEEGLREQKLHLTQGVKMGRKCDMYIDIKTTEGGEGIESVELSSTVVKVMEGTLTIDKDKEYIGSSVLGTFKGTEVEFSLSSKPRSLLISNLFNVRDLFLLATFSFLGLSSLRVRIIRLPSSEGFHLNDGSRTVCLETYYIKLKPLVSTCTASNLRR